MGESISLATVCSPMALKAMIRSPQVALGEFFLAKHQTFQPCVGLLLDKNRGSYLNLVRPSHAIQVTVTDTYVNNSCMCGKAHSKQQLSQIQVRTNVLVCMKVLKNNIVISDTTDEKMCLNSLLIYSER